MNLEKYYRYIDKHFKNIDNTKCVAITGATGSIGKGIATFLSYLKYRLVLVGRNKKRLEILKEELFDKFHNDIDIVVIDFMKKDTVLEGSNKLTELNIDVLINNAGIYHCDKQIVDNHDITYYVNFLMPMFLTNSLLKNNKNLKVINVASLSYTFTNINYRDLEASNIKNKTKVYANSKRILMLYSLYLKSLGYDVVLAHPGVSTTNLFSKDKKNYPALFYALCVPIMKVIFMNPYKASLPMVKCINEDVEDNNWVGPRGLAHAYGYPSKQKLAKNLKKDFNRDELKSIHEYIATL